MKLTFSAISSLMDAFNEIEGAAKLPFKLGLILAKNVAMLQQEEEFFVEKEREFALTYLEVDPETGMLVVEGENLYKIKEGKEQECREAREALNNFEVDVELRRIPASLLENMEFSLTTLMALEILIDEEA